MDFQLLDDAPNFRDWVSIFPHLGIIQSKDGARALLYAFDMCVDVWMLIAKRFNNKAARGHTKFVNTMIPAVCQHVTPLSSTYMCE
jgi:hypothetical protein